MATGVDAKLLRATKFPLIFNQKVDMQKVNLQVMKKYGIPQCHLILLFGVLTSLRLDGLPGRSPTSWVTTTTLSSSFATT